MFVIEERRTYQITRKSAMESLKKAIAERLENVYNNDFLTDVVEDVMESIIFPIVMDSNRVFVYKDGSFYEYELDSDGIIATGEHYTQDYFKPKYSGAIIIHIKEILDYDVQQLLYEQKGVLDALVLQTSSDRCAMVSRNSDYKKIISTALQEIITEDHSNTIADAIVKEISSDAIIMAGIAEGNRFKYFGLNPDGECSKKLMSARMLYKYIMKYLPGTKSIRKKVEIISNYLHNKLCLNIDFRECELTNLLEINRNGLIFEVCINGIRGFFESKTGRCRSELILVNTRDINLGQNWNSLYHGHKLAKYERDDVVMRYSEHTEGIPYTIGAHETIWDDDTGLRSFTFLENEETGMHDWREGHDWGEGYNPNEIFFQTYISVNLID